MAQKQVIWSERAEKEFYSILEFYNERNGNTKYSQKIVEATEKLLDLLQSNNYLGRLTENKKTRVINLNVYLIFYELSEHQIEILSFWDNRQNLKKRIDFE